MGHPLCNPQQFQVCLNTPLSNDREDTYAGNTYYQEMSHMGTWYIRHDNRISTDKLLCLLRPLTHPCHEKWGTLEGVQVGCAWDYGGVAPLLCLTVVKVHNDALKGRDLRRYGT